MLFERLMTLDYRRKRALQTCQQQGAMRDFLATGFPDSSLDFRQVTYTCLDLETTGLDIHHDHILSIGMVDIDSKGIDLGSAEHILVNSPHELPAETVTIHRLTDDMVKQGLPVKQALSKLLDRLRGKVLIAHHASIECGFVRQACNNLFDCDWLVPVIDTQQLGARRLRRRHAHHAPHETRLDSLRQHYRLPAYQAHNALADAIATAELFLAEITEIRGTDSSLALGKLLSRC
jgi:DNA polymerase-3 subunit epsilon